MMKPFAALLAAAALSAPLIAMPLSTASADSWRQITIDRRAPHHPPAYRPQVRSHQYRHYVAPRHAPPRHYGWRERHEWRERNAMRGAPGYGWGYYR